MPIDPDHVRVDLLKVKRKLFISYPEGSKERQVFITTAKVSELAYLQKLMPQETVDFVLEEYEEQRKSEFKGIALCLGVGLSASIMLFTFHQVYPDSLWFSTFYVPSLFGAMLAATHVMHLIDGNRRMKPFKAEYDSIKAKIKRITDELKGLNP